MKNLLMLGISFGVLAGLVGAEEPDRNTKWREDLRLLAEELPRKHKDFYQTLDRDTFRRAVAELDRQIPDLPDYKIVVGFARLAALAGDQLTSLNLDQKKEELHVFPYGFQWYADGVWAAVVPLLHDELLGARLTHIDGMPIDEVIKKLASAIPNKNMGVIRSRAPKMLNRAEILHATGVTKNRLTAILTFDTGEGDPVKQEAEAVPWSEWPPLARVTERPDYIRPLYLAEPTNEYWLSIPKDSKTALLQFNRARKRDSYPFATLVSETMRYSKEHDVQRIIVDLRHNRGGDPTIGPLLIDTIKKHELFSKHGRCFVIIGRMTADVGLAIALRLKRECGAIVVGEETVGQPNGFRKVESLKLPHCGYTVTYATEYEELLPGKKAWTLKPDIHAPQEWEKLIKGRDVPFEACMDWKPPAKPGS